VKAASRRGPLLLFSQARGFCIAMELNGRGPKLCVVQVKNVGHSLFHVVYIVLCVCVSEIDNSTHKSTIYLRMRMDYKLCTAIRQIAVSLALARLLNAGTHEMSQWGNAVRSRD
jgi:hypothetical protein